MKTHYKLAAAGALVGLLAVGVGTAAYAADSTKPANPMNNLVAALAQKFNLNQADVQKVFDDQAASMKAEHEQREKDMLAKAVTSGKLTQAQADAITAKKAELEAGREAFKASLQGKTQQEVQTLMTAQADSLKQSATANNIPEQYLRFLGGPGFGHGHGRGQGPGSGMKGQAQSPQQ